MKKKAKNKKIVSKKPSKKKKLKKAKRSKKVKRAKRAVKKAKSFNKAFFDPARIKKDIKGLEVRQRLQLVISEIKDIAKEQLAFSFSFGKMTSHQAKVYILLSAIIFAGMFAFIQRYEYLKLARENAASQLVPVVDVRKEKLEKKIVSVVKGSPIEKMAPYIAEKDEKTAAFIIGIAKKESNWGLRKPVLDGEDCFNYWGFRQERERMGSGGHTCFDNPKDAVDTVAKRIDQIIDDNNAKSAKNMIVWKCGYSCENHSDESVRSWISDVDYYAEKILN